MFSLCSFNVLRLKIKNNLVKNVYKNQLNHNNYGLIINNMTYDLNYLLDNIETCSNKHLYFNDNMLYVNFSLDDIYNNLMFYSEKYPETINELNTNENLKSQYFPVMLFNNINNIDCPLELKKAFIDSFHEILSYGHISKFKDSICMNYNDILKYLNFKDNINNENEFNEMLKKFKRNL